MLASVLERKGCQVLEARERAELLGILADGTPQQDRRPPVNIRGVRFLRMPGMTGLTILRWLRRANWRTPFVLMTAFGDPQAVIDALAAGADAAFDTRLH